MRDEGVFDLPNKYRHRLVEMITFHGDSLPSPDELASRAASIANMAKRVGSPKALVDGPGFLIATLERDLVAHGIVPYYAWGYVQRYKVDTETEGVERAKVRFVLSDLIPSPLYAHTQDEQSAGY
jgi:hypothetical protein